MLNRLKISARLSLGFGTLVLFSIVLIGIGAFGLNVADKSLAGITKQLIPANIVATRAKVSLIQSRAAQMTMLASFGNTEAIRKAKQEWDSHQVEIDKAAADFVAYAVTPQNQKSLADFKTFTKDWRDVLVPAMGKLDAGGYASMADAVQAMQPADKSYDLAFKLVAGIDTTMAEGSAALFKKVAQAMSAIYLTLLSVSPS
mgnify:CR=1 FL=1